MASPTPPGRHEKEVDGLVARCLAALPDIDAARRHAAALAERPGDRAHFALCFVTLELARMGDPQAREELPSQVGVLIRAYNDSALASALIGQSKLLADRWEQVRPIVAGFVAMAAAQQPAPAEPEQAVSPTEAEAAQAPAPPAPPPASAGQPAPIPLGHPVAHPAPLPVGLSVPTSGPLAPKPTRPPPSRMHMAAVAPPGSPQPEPVPAAVPPLATQAPIALSQPAPVPPNAAPAPEPIPPALAAAPVEAHDEQAEPAPAAQTATDPELPAVPAPAAATSTDPELPAVAAPDPAAATVLEIPAARAISATVPEVPAAVAATPTDPELPAAPAPALSADAPTLSDIPALDGELPEELAASPGEPEAEELEAEHLEEHVESEADLEAEPAAPAGPPSGPPGFDLPPPPPDDAGFQISISAEEAGFWRWAEQALGRVPDPNAPVLAGQSFPVARGSERHALVKIANEALKKHGEVRHAKALACLIDLYVAGQEKERGVFGGVNKDRLELVRKGLGLLGERDPAAQVAVLFESDGPQTRASFAPVVDIVHGFLAFCAKNSLDPRDPQAVSRYTAP